MKNRLAALLCAGFFLSPQLLFGADSNSNWHAQNLAQAIGYMLLFVAIGIAAAIIGYKLFDKFTPGDLHREIIENRNVAAAIVAAAVILGISLIIAVAMMS